MAGYKRVALNTIRQDFFNNLATLINSNKPTGWIVTSSYPESNPTFPCIVINPVKDVFKLLTLDRSKSKHTLAVEIEIFCLAEEGKEQVDLGKDNIQATLTAAFSTLKTYGLVLDTENPFTDSIVTTEIINDNKLNTASIDVLFKLV